MTPVFYMDVSVKATTIGKNIPTTDSQVHKALMNIKSECNSLCSSTPAGRCTSVHDRMNVP